MEMIPNKAKKISKISILFFSLALFFLFSDIVSAAPYVQSSLVSGINWNTSTLKRTAYGSDNFPTTWSNDDFIYTLYQDGGGFQGNSNDICRVDLGVTRISGSGASPSYDDYWGYGGSCSNYKATFGGKSYGIVSVGGTLHMLVGGKAGIIGDPDFLAPGGWGGSCWDAMSVTRVASSYDHGASWSLTGSDFFNYQNGVGYPSFLQYGKDYAGNTDGYIYVYSADVSGGENGRANKVTLLRVPKGEVRTASSYRYYTGTGWSSNSSDRQSIFTDTTNGVGLPSAIYHSGLGRYILVVPHGTPKGTCLGGSGEGGLGIFEGPNPWGPWKTIYYKDNWMGSDKMFYANISTKWISGNDFYLIFTGHDPDPIAQDAYQHMKGTFTLATQVPAATLSLSASPTSIAAGGSSTLTWTTNYATSCWASGGASGDGWKDTWKASANGAHTMSVSPSATRTYSMECWNSAGTSSGIKSVTVNVAFSPANTPPSVSITTPSSDGTSVAKGSTLNFSGTISDSDSSSLTYGWYIDRIGDGFLEALIKQGAQTPGNTSGSITMTGTKTNISNPSHAISLDTVGATYNLILKVSDGTNTEVQTIRSFILTDSAPTQYCGDNSCNNGEACSTCPGDCGTCSSAAPAVDAQATKYPASASFTASQERGESFKAGISGKLYSITLRRHASGSTAQMYFKVGSSTDLSSAKQFNCSVPTGAGEFECVIPEADRPTLTAGSTYHFLFRAINASQPSWPISRDTVNTNYSGTPYYDGSIDWKATTGTMDLYFKTKMSNWETGTTPPPATDPQVCTTDVMQCPDGSYVSRVLPSCEFASCPIPRTYTITDFTNLVNDWLKTLTGSPADVNSDGKVNSRDLGIMMDNWAF